MSKGNRWLGFSGAIVLLAVLVWITTDYLSKASSVSCAGDTPTAWPIVKLSLCWLAGRMDPSTPSGNILDLLASAGIATFLYRIYTRKARRFKKAEELLILAIENVREIERLVKDGRPDKAQEFCDLVARQNLPAALTKLQGPLLGKLPTKVEPDIETAKALIEDYRKLLDQGAATAQGQINVLMEVRSALTYARSVVSAAYLEWA